MIAPDIKAVLEDVKLTTKKIDEEQIIEFSRKADKKDLEEVRRLGKLLSKAIVDNNSVACEKITDTIAKTVRL